MTMTARERVMCALSGDQPDRVPFCEGNIAANVARALAGSDRDLSEREISELTGRDVVVPILFPPYFADTAPGVDGISYVTTGWLRTRADLERMVFPDPDDPALYAAARRVLDDRGEHACAAAVKLGVAPTLVSMGIDGFSFALKDDPWLIREVLRRYVDWQVVVTGHLTAMGFDFLWFYDDIAYKSGPFCSPAAFRELLLPAMRRSAEAITIPWVFHSDGNLMPIAHCRGEQRPPEPDADIPSHSGLGVEHALVPCARIRGCACKHRRHRAQNDGGARGRRSRRGGDRT